MWKIENTLNKEYLLLFESEIIIPIFNMIHDIVIEISNGKTMLPLKSKEVWKNTEVFLLASDDQKKLYYHIMQKTISGRKLEDILYLIVINFNPSYVEHIHELYKQQNTEVYAGNYEIQQETVDEYYQAIFVDFYYNKFFADEYIWSIIKGESYNRTLFHTNFRSDNKLSVCPYCDMDTIIAISNISIEHFLPKSKYPMLAMNPLNLISSCSACNKSHEGKGDRVSQAPIVTPYHEMIGDFAEFIIDFELETITLLNKGGQAHHNYFKLLRLYSRYSEPYTFECLDDAAHSLFETLSNYRDPSREAIELYIKRREKMSVLSFALRSAINKYSHYDSYK